MFDSLSLHKHWQRTRIHAFVPTNIAEALEPLLVVGKIYLFKNFTVKDYKSDDKFRCIHKTIQIVFSNETKIIELQENNVFIENAVFDFYDLADLKQLSKQTTYLTGNSQPKHLLVNPKSKLINWSLYIYVEDVIGVIEEQEVNLNKLRNRFGVVQPQMKFHITDGRFVHYFLISIIFQSQGINITNCTFILQTGQQ